MVTMGDRPVRIRPGSRRALTGALVLIAVAGGILVWRGAIGASKQVTTHEGGSGSVAGEVRVQVFGLPAGMAPKIYVVKPVVDERGGYIRQYLVGTFTAGTVNVPPDTVVEAEPIPLGQTLFRPNDRFQTVRRDAGSITFTYQKGYTVTVGKGYFGPQVSGFTFGEVPGNVSLRIGSAPVTDDWVPADSILTITATVPPGVRLLRWDITGGQTMSSTENPLRIKVTGPMKVAAEFRSSN